MRKNFFPTKTGHESSDKFFKNIPIWYDSDMIGVTLHGVVLGFVLGLLFGISL